MRGIARFAREPLSGELQENKSPGCCGAPGLVSLIPGGGTKKKNKMPGLRPYHFSLLSHWKVNFPCSINEKCPIPGHFIFLAEREGFEPSVQI